MSGPDGIAENRQSGAAFRFEQPAASAPAILLTVKSA
jgi:hypothetical protein